jgi:NADH-quinone oxidoreductase subunit C
MGQKNILEEISKKFSAFILETHSKLGQETVVIDKSRLIELTRFLKKEPGLEFSILADLTAVDYWKEKPRFQVVYHLLSLAHKLRLRIKVPVEESDCKVPSLCEIWPAANWYEREVFDMFGIEFEGHPDLKRILLYPGFEGHPLRKDYPKTRHQPLIEYRDLPVHGNPNTTTHRKKDDD